MRKIIITLLLSSTMSVNAELFTYEIYFSGNSPTPTSGSFTYDTTFNVFTSFNVTLFGTNINMLPSANSPVTQWTPGAQHACPLFSPADLYKTLLQGGQCNGFDLIGRWTIYPPNPPGNSFTTGLALTYLTANNEGVVIRGEYHGDSPITNLPTGTFTVFRPPSEFCWQCLPNRGGWRATFRGD